MKLREIILLLGGMITLLGFIAYMFDFYERTSELELIKRNMHFDSLILIEEKKLKEKDSIFEIRIEYMDSIQNEALKKRMNTKDRETYEKQIERILK